LQSVIYSVTVDGKSYSGTVQEESGGIYQASVPGLPSASGPSLDAAEANLGTIINALA
jgi:hypothetical protein